MELGKGPVPIKESREPGQGGGKPLALSHCEADTQCLRPTNTFTFLLCCGKNPDPDTLCISILLNSKLTASTVHRFVEH